MAVAGSEACLDIEYRSSPGGPFIDPPDARFDVLDPEGVVVSSDTPTTIVVSPGRHRGCYQSFASDTPGTWTMLFKATIDGEQRFTECPFTLEAPPSSFGGPCGPWPFDPACCDLPEGATDALTLTKQNEATRILWAASGRVYGPCPVTVRPCLRSCSGSGLAFGAHLSPYIGHDGLWRNASCACGADCSCGELCEVVLAGPVAGVIEVTIDGLIVDPDTYRLDKVGEQMRLVRTGEGCWPSCQDHAANCDEEGSFCVTYYKGRPLDELALAAMNQLTCELVKSCIPGCKTCLLPKHVATLSRRGVAQTFDTSKTWLRTLPMVDAFLEAVNPNGLQRPLRVSSPDSRGPRFVR